jgi:hypothetical protein
VKKTKEQTMTSIELSAMQREQMAGLIDQLNKTRTVAEAFVGYFAKELGVNLQMYQFNADSMTFDPVGGFAPVMDAQEPEPSYSENGKVEAI